MGVWIVMRDDFDHPEGVFDSREKAVAFIESGDISERDELFICCREVQ